MTCATPQDIHSESSLYECGDVHQQRTNYGRPNECGQCSGQSGAATWTHIGIQTTWEVPLSTHLLSMWNAEHSHECLPCGTTVTYCYIMMGCMAIRLSSLTVSVHSCVPATMLLHKQAIKHELQQFRCNDSLLHSLNACPRAELVSHGDTMPINIGCV
jgi:hypothetical protein